MFFDIVVLVSLVLYAYSVSRCTLKVRLTILELVCFLITVDGCIHENMPLVFTGYLALLVVMMYDFYRRVIRRQ